MKVKYFIDKPYLIEEEVGFNILLAVGNPYSSLSDLIINQLIKSKSARTVKTQEAMMVIDGKQTKKVKTLYSTVQFIDQKKSEVLLFFRKNKDLSVGLQFFLWYDTIFDFKSNAVYFKRHKRKLDFKSYYLEFSLFKVKGKTLVKDVFNIINNSKQIFKKNDEIIEIDDKNTDQYEIWQILDQFTKATKKSLKLKIKRNSKVHMINYLFTIKPDVLIELPLK